MIESIHIHSPHADNSPSAWSISLTTRRSFIIESKRLGGIDPCWSFSLHRVHLLWRPTIQANHSFLRLDIPFRTIHGAPVLSFGFSHCEMNSLTLVVRSSSIANVSSHKNITQWAQIPSRVIFLLNHFQIVMQPSEKEDGGIVCSGSMST